MSDGELIKQIKIFSAAYTRVKDGKIDMINGDLIKRDDYFNLVVDEARKDFPRYDKIMKMTGEAFDGEEYNELHNEDYISGVNDWFKKWFGD